MAPKRQPPTTHTPGLLRLPLELRQQIYSHLLPAIPTSHPLPSTGITSVTHPPPTSSLLNIHPQLTDEILSYYYNQTTWKLIFSHAFNFFRVDPLLHGLERSAALHRMRRVELVFYCDILLLEGLPDGGKVWNEMKKRATRAVDVLSQASSLREVVVSWVDTTSASVDLGDWGQKVDVLTPLRKLNGKVKFKVGQVLGGESFPSRKEEWDREAFAHALQQALGDGAVGSFDGTCDEFNTPAKIRLLAFDVRQERHLAAGNEGVYSLQMKTRARSGVVGWTPIAL